MNPHRVKERYFDIHWLHAEFQGGASDMANIIGQNIAMIARNILCATNIP